MERINESKVTEKKSKFFGYLFSIDSLKEINEIIEEVSHENKKACHICYGALFEGEEIFKNNGEVGNPGKALLEILKNNNLNAHILVVARIYGGIKLGPAGVGKAFREAGKAAIQ